MLYYFNSVITWVSKKSPIGMHIVLVYSMSFGPLFRSKPNALVNCSVCHAIILLDTLSEISKSFI